MESPPPAPTPTLGERARRFFTTLAVAGILAAVAAGYVAYQGYLDRTGLEASMEIAEAQCNADKEALRQAQAAERVQLARLFALVDLTHAGRELDEGNFGRTRTRVASAADQLRTTAEDDALVTALERVDVQVTEDPSATKDVLASLAEQIEQLLPSLEPADD